MKRWMVVLLILYLFMIVIGGGIINSRVRSNTRTISINNQEAIRANVRNAYLSCLDRNDLANKLKTAISVSVEGIPQGASSRIDNLRLQGLSITERDCEENRDEALDKLLPRSKE